MLRRAQARHAQAKYEGALEDLEAALEREPRNGGARQLMAECRRLKAAAVPKPKPKLTRVSIEQLQRDQDNDNDPFVMALAVTPAVDADSGRHDAPESPSRTDGLTSIAPNADPSPPSGLPSAPRSLPKSTATADSFGMPATLAEMERAWRSLRNAPEEFGELVRRMDASHLGRLFKSNLPAELFSAILAALDAHFFPSDAARALEILKALTGAGRFSILTMCLDKSDNQAIAAIFEKLEGAQARSELPDDAELATLRKQYA
jgi:hypothetical protein